MAKFLQSGYFSTNPMAAAIEYTPQNDGNLKISCIYRLTGHKNEPNLNAWDHLAKGLEDLIPMGDVKGFYEKHQTSTVSVASMWGYIDGVQICAKGDQDFENAKLEWHHTVPVARGTKVTVVVVRANINADPVESQELQTDKHGLHFSAVFDNDN